MSNSSKTTREYEKLRDYLIHTTSVRTPFSPFDEEGKDRKKISEEIRKKALANDELEQKIKLKRYTLIALFAFLGIETFFVFLFSYYQGTGFHGFMLEEWSFKLLVAATLSQITYMLQVAVRHLFPKT